MAADQKKQHPIDITRGGELRDAPVGVPYEVMRRFWNRTGDCPVKRSKRRIAIMSMLATGWLPWGIRWMEGNGVAFLPWCGNEYIMCCGHVMRPKEAQAFVDSGLLMAGEPDEFGRPTLVITDAGKAWLSQNW